MNRDKRTKTIALRRTKQNIKCARGPSEIAIATYIHPINDLLFIFKVKADTIKTKLGMERLIREDVFNLHQSPCTSRNDRMETDSSRLNESKTWRCLQDESCLVPHSAFP
jgi:hypothetical protein